MKGRKRRRAGKAHQVVNADADDPGRTADAQDSVAPLYRPPAAAKATDLGRLCVRQLVSYAS